MIDKRALRARMRAVRDAHGPGLIPVPRPFLDRLFPQQTIAAYRPLGAEADPALWVEAALHAGATIALPHVTDRASPLRFLTWADGEALTVGAFGLHQPAPDAPNVAPTSS